MSVLTSRPERRWLVPVGAAVAVLAGGFAIGAITEAADSALPARSPAELLTDVQTARPDGLSGTLVYTADLGLPALPGDPAGGPGSDGLGGADLSSLVAGTHTLRVWYSEPDKSRVALLGPLGETDVITSGQDMWIWNSRANQATHRTLPERAGPAGRAGTESPLPGSSPGAGMNPQLLANLALAAIGPSTEVSTDATSSVAGRDAYELVVTPRDPGTLIASVRLAIDAEEKVPLRVQIFARGHADPALEVAFTQVSFARPDDSQFTFNPPPGAQVSEADGPDHQTDGRKPARGPGSDPGAADQRPAMATVGSGWTTVLVLRAPAPPTGADAAADQPGVPAGLAGFLEQLPSGPAGGRVLTGRLFSVLLTDDGRILIGAVGADALARAAADPGAQLPS